MFRIVNEDFEISAKNVSSMLDVEAAFFGDGIKNGSYRIIADGIQSRQEALEVLRRHKNSARKLDYTASAISGTIFYAEEYTVDDDGIEEISDGYDVSEWETDLFK